MPPHVDNYEGFGRDDAEGMLCRLSVRGEADLGEQRDDVALLPERDRTGVGVPPLGGVLGAWAEGDAMWHLD